MVERARAMREAHAVAPVAQRKEQPPPKRKAAGSTPARGATSAPAEPREAAAGASPEVEAGDGGHVTEWRPAWEVVVGKLADAEAEVERLRAERVGFLRVLQKRNLTLAQIAEVTGLTRQRVGQLLGKR